MTYKKNQGAILFISLIILLLVTIIAISTTRLSTIGQRTALNYQLQNTVFQAAESALNRSTQQLNSSEFALAQAAENNGLQTEFKYSDERAGLSAEATSTTRRVEAMVTPGFSLGVGKGLPQFHLYETTSTATISNQPVNTELLQGFIIRRLND